MKSIRPFKALCAVGFLLFTATSFAGDKDKPNVLLIMTDTQRKDVMGAYGNQVIKTPNLDMLASTGIMFQNCYVQYAACMPARATIFTGRYPMANGVWSNGVNLPEDEITLADVFLQNGYRTGGAGKFHFLAHYPYRQNVLPTMDTYPGPFYGFQEFHLGEDGNSGEHGDWIEQNWPEYVGKPNNEVPLELTNSYWTASHTISFIQKCALHKEPFFAFCSFVDPHQAYNPPAPYSEMYSEENMPEPVRRPGELDESRFKRVANSPNYKQYTESTMYMRTQYYGEMTLIDDMVGRVLDELDELGLRDNTLIVFVSDHGDMLGDHWLWWKGGFHWPGGTNVPLFYNWPGNLQDGKSVEGMVQHTDILPTILELVGLDIPPGVQGYSQKPVLTSETTNTGYTWAYTESIGSGEYHPEYFDSRGKRDKRRNENPVNIYTIRNLEWRITYHSGAGTGELYSLAEDPDEFVNLWNDPSYTDKRIELMEILMNRVANTRDPLPMKIRPY
ncbi:sulfatase [Bacteroidota bacterium]